MEPHVFCGPEFLLAIPEANLADVLVPSTGPSTSESDEEPLISFDRTLRPDVLTTFQTDIFNVLTPHLRRRLHHGLAQAPPASAASSAALSKETLERLDRQQRQKRMTSSSLSIPRHQGAVPPPPRALHLLEPLIRYPRAFKGRLATPSDADKKSEHDGDSDGQAEAGAEANTASQPAPSTEARGAVAVAHAPALTPTSADEEELLLNTVRVMTTQRPSSSSVGPQTTTAALSAALAASAVSASPGSPAAVSFFLLYVCDARVAAELYMLCLGNFHISLSHGAKLYAVFARTAKAAPVVLEDVLSRRETLKAHANMDSDLHEVLEASLTDAFVDGVMQAHTARRAARGGGGGGAAPGLLTSEARHTQQMEAVVQYCEEKVQYAGVLDNDGEASPFLLAMGLVLRFELTAQDLLRHFLPHPRRVVRAVALFVARYVVPPEDLGPFFAPTVGDAVVIACTEDQSVTTSLQDLAKQLLENDEVCEAWLPGAQPWKRYWLPRVILPLEQDMARFASDQKQARERRLTAAATGAEDADGDGGKAEPGTGTSAAAATGGARGQGAHTSASDVGDSLCGSGRGVGALGFRKLTDLVTFARQKERNVAYETLKRRLGQHRDGGGSSGDNNGAAASRKRPRDGEATADGDDWELVMQEQDDNDDFLINIEVDGGDDAEDAFGARHAPTHAAAPNGLVGGGDAAPIQVHVGGDGGGRGDAAGTITQRQKERLTARQTAMKEGYALALGLLARVQPFQRDERYLDF